MEKTDPEVIRLLERTLTRQETMSEEINRLRVLSESQQTRLATAEARFINSDRAYTNWPAWLSAIVSLVAIGVSLVKH